MPFHHRARRLWPGLALNALIALIVVAAIGCGSRGGESTPDHSGTPGDTTAASPGGEGTPASGSAAATGAATDGSTAAEPGVVRLVDKGCVQFEPHWVSVAPGQSVTWVSELTAPVTVHVDAGAFAKTEFVIAPGARVVSGPAGAAQDYKVWTEPNACQGPPLGARGSGPGVSVSTSPEH